MSNYPPGVTEKEISGPDMPLCDTCGREFSPQHDETTCEPCLEERPRKEFAKWWKAHSDKPLTEEMIDEVQEIFGL
jgi:hypothetical protein